MGEEKNVIPNDEKMEAKAVKAGFFKRKTGEFKGEFAKIIWPSRKDLIKESTTVIITCIIFGAVICSMDWVFSSGYQLIVSYISK